MLPPNGTLPDEDAPPVEECALAAPPWWDIMYEDPSPFFPCTPTPPTWDRVAMQTLSANLLRVCSVLTKGVYPAKSVSACPGVCVCV